MRGVVLLLGAALVLSSCLVPAHALVRHYHSHPVRVHFPRHGHYELPHHPGVLIHHGPYQTPHHGLHH